MDDHVHALVCPVEGNSLQRIVHSWKSYTANRLQRKFGREQAVWQDESFDRIVRNRDELLHTMEYIANNPQKRWPHVDEYQWLRFFEFD